MTHDFRRCRGLSQSADSDGVVGVSGPLGETESARHSKISTPFLKVMGNKTNSLKDLWQEARQWFELNIDYAKLTVAEKLSVLAAAAAVGIVCLLLGVIVLFFLSIAAVYWLSLTGMSVALSYTIMAGFNLLLLVAIFMLRRQIIIDPIAKFISRLILR